jgi:hypothetical protein
MFPPNCLAQENADSAAMVAAVCRTGRRTGNKPERALFCLIEGKEKEGPG